MTPDELAAIKARHEGGYYLTSEQTIALLAEVERLGKKVENQRKTLVDFEWTIRLAKSERAILRSYLRDGEKLGGHESILADLRKEARAAGFAKAVEMAARIASDACLVPPDGGEPSMYERTMCEAAQVRIRALTDPEAGDV